MRDFVIYEIKNIKNNKKYIGKAVDSQIRWADHKRTAKKEINLPLYNAIRKYGIKNFMFTIIFNCKHNIQSLNFHETRLIKKYNTLVPSGYNIAKGGNGGDIFNSLSIKDQNKKRRIHSEYLKIHNPMHNGSVYDHWIRTYGYKTAMKMRHNHIQKIKKTKSIYINTNKYKLKISKRMKKIKSKGLSFQHKQRLSEHNSVRYRMDEIRNMFVNKKSIKNISLYFNVSCYTIRKKLQIMKLIPSDREQKYIDKYGQCEIP
jgi:group I intron endonuclease